MNPAKPPIAHQFRNPFGIVNGELVIGGIPITRLAERAGGTPFYAYDRAVLASRVQKLRKTLPEAIVLHYAMKANPMPAVVDHMARMVDGLDVASARELRAALDSGMNPREISFAGPGKQVSELRQAIASDILLNVESPTELARIHDICRATGWPARVAIRVNPDFELKSSGMKMGGGPKQFGIDAEQVPDVLRSIDRKLVRFEGFHLYAGAQNLQAANIVDAQQKCFDLAVRLAQAAPGPVVSLNLGGGFGIPYFPGEPNLELEPIGANLAHLLARAKQELPAARLTIELGRYLVGEAGVYVCRVVDKKVSRGHTFLITDGGLHQHLSASGNFGQVIRKNYPVAIANRMDSTTQARASVVGPLCTPLDLLADSMLLAEAQVGDLVAIFQSGAYGFSASPQAFLSHPAPVELLA